MSRQQRVVIRLALAATVGLAVSTAVGAIDQARPDAPAVGWIAAACVYLGWTWIVVFPMDAERTRDHVGPEDPPRGWASDVVVLLACGASLVGVGHTYSPQLRSTDLKGMSPQRSGWSVLSRRGSSSTPSSVSAMPTSTTRTRGVESHSKGTEEPWFQDFPLSGLHHRHRLPGVRHRAGDTAASSDRTIPKFCSPISLER